MCAKVPAVIGVLCAVRGEAKGGQMAGAQAGVAFIGLWHAQGRRAEMNHVCDKRDELGWQIGGEGQSTSPGNE